MTPFDYLKSINETKQDIMETKTDEKDYNSWIINRGLSMFMDTILYANEMNKAYESTPRMQYDYYLASIPKKKRWSKWPKKISDDLVNLISEECEVTKKEAQRITTTLSKEQLSELETRLKELKKLKA